MAASFPEIAARAHIECLYGIIAEAMAGAGLGFGISRQWLQTQAPASMAACRGPRHGKNAGMALANGKPFLAVNHSKPTPSRRASPRPRPALLLLLVSGGHTQILLVEAPGRYQRLGTHIDDAIGEAFDKTAKLLGSPNPAVLRSSAWQPRATGTLSPAPSQARPRRAALIVGGLKTAVRLRAEALVPLKDQDVADLSPAFEAAISISSPTAFIAPWRSPRSVWATAWPRHLAIAGGVADNKRLRASLEAEATEARLLRRRPPARSAPTTAP